MASPETDTSANWQADVVLSTRHLPYPSNAPNPRPPQPQPQPRLTHEGRASRQDDAIYHEVMGRMRRRGLLLKQESDSDSVNSVTEEDMPGFEEHETSHSLPVSVANSLLFSLPREIRDRIYALCLQSRESLPVEWPRPESHRELHPYHIQTQLLRTCRIVHSESAPLLYTLNNLTFQHPSDSNIFVRALCDTNFGRRITNLSLHIKAGDVRIWMSYLTSSDPHRSLRSDFPNIRELGLRYKSSRWNHGHTAEHNLKSWIDDSRLDELLNGVRGVYNPYWCTPQEQKARAEEEQELSGFDASNTFPEPEFQWADERERNRERYLELRRTRIERDRHRDLCPVIRICCACRVHPTHFGVLTARQIQLQLQQELYQQQQQQQQQRQAEQQPSRTAGLPQSLFEQPPVPLVEGDVFPLNGFSPLDLQRDVKKLHDPELGSANVSRTPYVARKGVLIALEIHSVDPRRE